MNSIDKALRNKLCKMFNDNPDWFIILGEKIKLIRNNAWPNSLVDCVYQYDWHHEPDIYDAYVFTQLHVLMQNYGANIGVFQVPTGCEPLPDKYIQENNEILKCLSPPFTGEFWGGNQDEDGYIRWNKPIYCTRFPANKEAGGIQWGLIESMQASLEVGYNSSGKFWYGINEPIPYARWPYGQKYITVFVNFDLINFYTIGTKNFEKILESSKETIEQCLYQKGRSPWDRWKEEINLTKSMERTG